MATSIYDREGNKVGEITSVTDNDDCEYRARGDSLMDSIIVNGGVFLCGLVLFGLLCLIVWLL